MSPLIELKLFGAPRLLIDGTAVRTRRRKSLAILAYLSLAEGPRTREHLAAMFWPETDASHAFGSLRIALHEISTICDLLVVNGDSVALDTARCTVDVLRFLAMASPPAERTSTFDLEEAAGLYEDEFLRGFGLRDAPDFDDWVFFTAESLQARLTALLDELVRRLTPEDTGRAIAYAQRLVHAESLDEDHHRTLIELYVTEGRYSAAIRQYEQCRRVLARELGETPSSDLVAFCDRIRGCIDDAPCATEGESYLPHAGAEFSLSVGATGDPRPSADRRRSRLRARAVVAFLAAIVCYLAVGTAWRSGQPPRIPTIAVLPFAYAGVGSDRPQLAREITRYVETLLVEDSGLVVKRGSAADPAGRGAIELRRYGRRNGIDYIVEGGVLDSDGEIGVTVQVVETRRGELLLGDRFNAGDADLGVELTFLAQTVTEEIYLTLAPRVQEYLLSGEVLLNPWCETSYLLTRYHSERNLSESDRARLYVTIKENLVDPYVCEGYFLNADSYWATGMYGVMPPAPAGELLRIALETGGSELRLPERDLARGIYALYYEGDVESASRAIDAAYEANPGDVSVGRWHALMLALAGRYDAALEELDRVRRFSPHDPAIPIYRSTFLYKAGRYEEAIEAAEVSIARNNRWIGLTQQGKALIQLGRLAEAAQKLEASLALQGTMQETKAYLAYARAMLGNRARARELRADLRATANDDPARSRSTALEAIVELGFGRTEVAVELLVDALKTRDPVVWLLYDDPVLEPLRPFVADLFGDHGADRLTERPSSELFSAR